MPFVICDYGPIEANFVPASCLGSPGFCPVGIYDTALLEAGEIVSWENHWSRFVAGCELLGIQHNLGSFKAALLECTAAINTRSRLRTMAFEKPVELNNGKYTKCMSGVWPSGAVANPEGIGCRIGSHRRSAWDISYNIKMLGRAYVDEELAEARASGFSDLLFCNDRDEVCEGSYSNVFVVIDGVAFTSPIESPCLPGITRKLVIDAAVRLKIPVKIEPISLGSLYNAQEIFLTSSVRGLSSLTHIDGVIELPPQQPIRTLLATSSINGKCL